LSGADLIGADMLELNGEGYILLRGSDGHYSRFQSI